jgi:hypothetical protein
MKVALEDEKEKFIDDLAIGYDGNEKIVGVHLERMDQTYFWLGIDLADGTTVHIDIFKLKSKKTKIHARLRESG